MAAGGRRIPPWVWKWLRVLVLLAVVLAVVLGSLYAVTRVWPPLVVVKSGSMQHSNDTSFVGVLDTGDMLLVQGAPRPEDILTYVEGRPQGYNTYGDYGDVILFQRPGNPAIIHRPIFRVLWNDTAQGFDIPSLLNLERGVDWNTSGETPFGLRSGASVVLHNVSFRDLSIDFPIARFIAEPFASRCIQENPCYVTMGDNNAPTYDPFLTRHSWVVGRACGELPWLGLFSLVLGGGFAVGDSRVPANSWTSLGVVLLVLIGALLAWEIVRWRRGSRRRRLSEVNEGGLGPVVSALEERWERRKEAEDRGGEGPESGEPPPGDSRGPNDEQ